MVRQNVTSLFRAPASKMSPKQGESSEVASGVISDDRDASVGGSGICLWSEFEGGDEIDQNDRVVGG